MRRGLTVQQWVWRLGACWLIALSIALRFATLQGLTYADDYAYVNAALDANEKGWLPYVGTLSSHFENRLAIVFPLALALRVFGASERVIAAVPMAANVGAIVVSFWLGKRLRNTTAGLIAALVIAFIPQDLWFSSVVLPDTFIPLYVGLAMLCLVAGLHGEYRPAAEIGLYVGAGLFTLCAAAARPSSIALLAPLALSALWSRRSRGRAVIVPALTVALAGVVVWLATFVMSGDALLLYRQLAEDALRSSPGTSSNPPTFLYSMAPLVRIVITSHPVPIQAALESGHIRSWVNSRFGLFFYLALLAWAAGAWWSWKHERYRLPVVSFLILYLVFEFGSASPVSYRPFWKLDRFLTILSVPGALVVALAMERMASVRGRLASLACKAAAVGLLVAYVVVSWAMVMEMDRAQTPVSETYARTFDRLRALDLSPRIYVVHWRWEQRGRTYMRMAPSQPHEFRLLNGVDVASIHSAVVIVDESFFGPGGEFLISWDGFDPALTEIPERLPAGWVLVFTEERPLGGGRPPQDVTVLYAP